MTRAPVLYRSKRWRDAMRARGRGLVKSGDAAAVKRGRTMLKRAADAERAYLARRAARVNRGEL